MKPNLLLFLPTVEFHAFTSHDAFLYFSCKKKYEKIACVLHPDAIPLMTQVDEFYTISPKIIEEDSLHYNTLAEEIYKRASLIWILGKLYLEKNRGYFIDYDIMFSDHIKVYDEDNNIYFDEYSLKTHSADAYIQRDFGLVAKYISSGNTIKPEKEIYDTIIKKTGIEFSNPTYILITRNIKRKAIYDTLKGVPNLKEMIKYLCNAGITIINAGYPPEKLEIIDKNYHELNIPFSEVLALSYHTNGVLKCGNAAAYTTWFACNIDMFLITDEAQSHNKIVFDSRFDNKTIYSEKIQELVIDSQYRIIADKLINHKQVFKKQFAETKPIIYLPT